MGMHAKISERLAPRFKIMQISSRQRLLGKCRIHRSGGLYRLVKGNARHGSFDHAG